MQFREVDFFYVHKILAMPGEMKKKKKKKWRKTKQLNKFNVIARHPFYIWTTHVTLTWILAMEMVRDAPPLETEEF